MIDKKTYSNMKTKLLRKLRREAFERIGLFQQSDGQYRILFCKTGWGDVSEYAKANPEVIDEDRKFNGCQIVAKDIFEKSEAIERCDNARKIFILNEVRRRRYGNEKRIH